MRAITVLQPFADALIWGPKTIENRTTNLGLKPGEWVGIHAGKEGYAERALRNPVLIGRFDRWLDELWPAHATSPQARGALVGVACVDRVVPYHQVAGDPWAMSGHDHCIVFRHRIPLQQPLVCRGALGAWALEPHLEHALCRLVAEMERARCTAAPRCLARTDWHGEAGAVCCDLEPGHEGAHECHHRNATFLRAS